MNVYVFLLVDLVDIVVVIYSYSHSVDISFFFYENNIVTHEYGNIEN